MSVTTAGELFPNGRPSPAPKPTYRVSVAGDSVLSCSCPSPWPRPRAAALRGYPAWLRDEAGHCAHIAVDTDGALELQPHFSPPGLDSCRALLADHS